MDKNIIQQLRGFMRLAGGFRASRVILTANNFAVFEHLTTPKTAAALCRKIKTDPRATEILLDAVTALGLLKKTGRQISKYRVVNNVPRQGIADVPGRHAASLRHALEKLVRPRSSRKLACRTAPESVITSPSSGPCITTRSFGQKT